MNIAEVKGDLIRRLDGYDMRMLRLDSPQLYIILNDNDWFEVALQGRPNGPVVVHVHNNIVEEYEIAAGPNTALEISEHITDINPH